MDCVADAYVTLEHQHCCVTLAAVENMFMRLCAGISKHGIVTGDLTVNLASKDREVPFNILLACLDKRQGSWVPKETFFSLFSEFAVKILQHFLNLYNSRAKLYWHILNGHSCNVITLLFNSHVRFYHMIHRFLVSWASKVSNFPCEANFYS